MLTWDRPMTSKQAEKYLLTKGFVAQELYDVVVRENELMKSLIKSCLNGGPVSELKAAIGIVDR